MGWAESEAGASWCAHINNPHYYHHFYWQAGLSMGTYILNMFAAAHIFVDMFAAERK